MLAGYNQAIHLFNFWTACLFVKEKHSSWSKHFPSSIYIFLAHN